MGNDKLIYSSPLSVNDPRCGAETDSVSILKRANPPRAITRSCYSCDLGLSELFGHSYSGCEDHSRREEKIKGGRDRKKIRAATLIFDVIKRHSPQPVDDITDTIGTISGLFLGRNSLRNPNLGDHRYSDSVSGWMISYPHALLLLLHTQTTSLPPPLLPPPSLLLSSLPWSHFLE